MTNLPPIYPLIKRSVPLCNGRSLVFSDRPLVMGIVNCTPDSFYDKSRSGTLDQALDRVRSLIDQGADILDLGGESSRPGADYVTAEEEIDRVVPVVREIRKISSIPISVDTRKSEVAERVLEAGADMINDISALEDDSELGRVVADCGAAVVLMHKRGVPKTMQDGPFYSDAVEEVRSGLEAAVTRALDAGIAREKIFLDPGIGFGKRLEDNLTLLRHLNDLRLDGFPLLVGLSRKSFIDHLFSRPPERRLAGTIGADLWCALQGTEILRVHDVEETMDSLSVFQAISRG